MKAKGNRRSVVLPVPLSRKMLVVGRGTDYKPRVTHRVAHKKNLPRYRIACGCCSERVDIYYDIPDVLEIRHATLEIGGIISGVEDWRDILMPLLGFEQRGEEWKDKFRANKT